MIYVFIIKKNFQAYFFCEFLIVKQTQHGFRLQNLFRQTQANLTFFRSSITFNSWARCPTLYTSIQYTEKKAGIWLVTGVSEITQQSLFPKVKQAESNKSSPLLPPREPPTVQPGTSTFVCLSKNKTFTSTEFVSSVLLLNQGDSHSVCYDNKVTGGLSSLQMALKLSSTKITSAIINSDRQ